MINHIFKVFVLKYKQEKGLHPTQKPVALMEYLIKTYTNKGDIVLDNTMGSGTTGLACVNTGRDFIGIELDKKYYKFQWVVEKYYEDGPLKDCWLTTSVSNPISLGSSI